MKFIRMLDDRGVAALEFALVAPVLGFLFVAAWDFGNALVQQERLASAARAGAQYGLLSSSRATDYAGMVAAARSDAGAGAAVAVTAQQVCACPGGSAVGCGGSCAGGTWPMVYLQVVATQPYATLASYPFVANPVPLTGRVTMRVQ